MQENPVTRETWKALDLLPPEARDEMRARMTKPLRIIGTTLDAIDLKSPNPVLFVHDGSPDGLPVPDVHDADGFVIRLRAPVTVVDADEADMFREAIAKELVPKLGPRPLPITAFDGGYDAWGDIHRVVGGLGSTCYVQRVDEDGESLSTLAHTARCVNLINSAAQWKDSDLLIVAAWAWREHRREREWRQNAGMPVAVHETDRKGKVTNWFPNASTLVQRLRNTLVHHANRREMQGAHVEAQWRNLVEKAGLA